MEKRLVYESEVECSCREFDKTIRIYHINGSKYLYTTAFYRKCRSAYPYEFEFTAEGDNQEQLLEGLRKGRSLQSEMNSF